MTTPCGLELDGVPIPVWQAEFTLAVIHGGGGGGPGGPAAWGSITGTIASQADLAVALAAKANTATLAPVATSGAYADLTGTPMLGTAAAANLGDFAPTVHAHLAASITDSTPVGRALLTAADATAARSTLGLGSAAQSAASSFATSAQGGKADTALQPGAGLSAIDSAAASKLAGVQAGATTNSTDAQLRDRGTHTGTQLAATISDLYAAISTMLQAGNNVTITPSGGQLVIASVGGGGGGGSVTWGGISGTLGNQTDLQTALNAKANTASMAAVATAGTYASLTGKPTLGTAAASNTGDFAAASHSHAASAISDSTATGRALLTTANAASARSTLGLGSAATSAAGDFATAAQGTKADSAVQPAGLAPYATTVDVNNKVDKVAGKGLSTEDYSSAEKAKLAGIAAGATANSADADLRDRATHTGSQAISTITGLSAAIAAKQDTLVSGSNLKTVNGQSLLGAGNLVISGGGGGSSAWADITGKPQLLSSEGWQAAILPGRGGQLTTFGTLTDVLSTGTITHAALNTASLRQSLPRFTVTSAAAAGSSLDLIGRNLLMTRGDAAGLGGFTQTLRFSVSNTTSARRGFIGMRGSTTGWGGTSFAPNGVALCVGVGFDAAIHANYQIAHAAHTNNSGSYVDTGIPLSNPESVLELRLSSPPNGDAISWSLKDLNSGASASGSISSNIPDKQTVYSPRVRMDNNGDAVAVSCDVMGIWMSNYLG